MKAKILIASTLKPVWDPRAYEKLGKSLVSKGEYEVEIIGSGHTIPADKKIKFYPIIFKRNLFIRLTNRIKIFRIICLSRPELLIITTHELIVLAVLYHFLYKKKIIYDIRENYNYNLRYQKIYPAPVRYLLASFVRFKEHLFQQYFAHFILAEKCYLEEIKFLRQRPQKCLILENKCAQIVPLKRAPKDEKIQLLLSGTISVIYGVYEALHFYEQLPSELFALTIIGHCPSKPLRKYLTDKANSLDGLRLCISSEPVPHDEIVATYTNKSIGILPYRPNESLINKVPTKLYEYLAHGIPVLISPNENWNKIIQKYNGGWTINFNQPPVNDIIRISNHLINTSLSSDIKELMWYSSENKFLSLIQKVL